MIAVRDREVGGAWDWSEIGWGEMGCWVVGLQ